MPCTIEIVAGIILPRWQSASHNGSTLLRNRSHDRQILRRNLEIEKEEDEEEVVVNYDIASYPSDFTLSGIAQMWADKDIVIPDYQREFVWTIKQSSLLIDSFLCGLPVPPVFFYVDENNQNLVIDGQQRILSVAFSSRATSGGRVHREEGRYFASRAWTNGVHSTTRDLRILVSPTRENSSRLY